MNKLNAREALIAEMLGDVGRLHDSIASLKGVIEQTTDNAIGRINVQIGQLIEAAQQVQNKLDAAVKSAAHQVARVGQEEVINLKVAVREGAKEAAISAMGDATKEAVKVLAKARVDLEEAAIQMRQVKPDSGFIKVFAATALGGAIAVFLGISIWVLSEKTIMVALGNLPAAEKHTAEKDIACLRLVPLAAKTDKPTTSAILTLCR